MTKEELAQYYAEGKNIKFDEDSEEPRYFGYKICCREAKRVFCVCLIKTVCLKHGVQCHGSHD